MLSSKFRIEYVFAALILTPITIAFIGIISNQDDIKNLSGYLGIASIVLIIIVAITGTATLSLSKNPDTRSIRVHEIIRDLVSDPNLILEFETDKKVVTKVRSIDQKLFVINKDPSTKVSSEELHSLLMNSKGYPRISSNC